MSWKKNSLICIMLLAVLISIPLVDADEYPSASMAVIAAEIQLPQLHFNNSQAKVVVTGELSPEQSTEFAKATAMAQIPASLTIPFGSIIYHTDNVTTVFDATGQQLLAAYDAQAATIHTFRGNQLATFVHEVPDKSVIVDDGDILHVIHNNTRILTIIRDNPSQSQIPASTQTCYGTPYDAQWIEGTEAPIVSSSSTQFSADWNVPSSPPKYLPYEINGIITRGSPVAIWNGIYSCVNGNPTSGLVQPVLEWYWADNLNSIPTSAYWTMSTWYVWSNQTLAQNNWPPDSIHSTRSKAVYSGDQIRGNININTNNYDAFASITDLGPDGGGSTLFLTEYTAPTRMSSQNLYAQIVIEGGDPTKLVYPQGIPKPLTAQYLPGPVTFKNFVLTDYDGNNLLTTTPMTSFVNSQYWNQNTFADAGNLTVYNQWPSRITLVNNRDRVNPPVADFAATVYGGVGSAFVVFQDKSAGSPFLWHWDFGDGKTSTDQNPVHQYLIPGSYTVSLTVWNAGGVSSKVKPNYIIVFPFPPVPSFKVNIDSGDAPLAVQFTDTSSGNATSWYWDFGDGQSSTLRNDAHIYTRGGVFTATLTAGNSGGNSTSAPQTITVYPFPPVAGFIANTTTGPSPLTVRFTDTSTNAPTSWLWDFGDGQTSPIQNPEHKYILPKKYTVHLTATNAGGSGTETKTDYITVTTPPTVADFSAEPTSGNTPLTVRFTDTSGGNPTGWNWYFGDGGSSNLQNPVHTFSGNRSYTVTLIALNNGGSSTKTRPDYITVITEPPVAIFTATPTSGTDPLLVRFTDTSTNTPTSWTWDFGDGKTNTLQNPKHVYTSPGTFTVTLTVTNAGGSDTETRTGFITVESTPSGTYEFTWDDNGKTVTVEKGSKLNITLMENHSTGYAWRFFNSKGLTETGNMHIPSSSGLLGAPGTRVVSYTADTPGSAAISAWYIPPGTTGVITDPFADSGPESDTATRYLLLLNIT